MRLPILCRWESNMKELVDGGMKMEEWHISEQEFRIAIKMMK